MDSTYDPAPVPGLLYQQELLVNNAIEALQERKLTPVNKGDVNPGDDIEFKIHDPYNIDLRSIYLNFKYTAYNADGVTKTPANGWFDAAWDLFDKIIETYEGIPVETITQLNTWANVYLMHNATENWFKYEGNVATKCRPLALRKQTLNLPSYFVAITSAGDVKTELTDVPYVVNADTPTEVTVSFPLYLIAPFFQCPYYLPCYGNEFAITLHTETAANVMQCRSINTDTYKLSNVSLSYCSIKLTDDYSKIMVNAMREGNDDLTVSLPYTSYQTKQASVEANTTQNLRWTHTCANAITVQIVHSPNAVKKTICDTAETYPHRFQSYPLENFSKFYLTMGGDPYIENHGITTFEELFRTTQLCIGGITKLNGDGIIDSTTLKAGYTAGAAEAKDERTCFTGMCVLSANLEKTIEQDYNAINSGVNSKFGRDNIEALIETSVALVATSAFYTNVVHKRTLIIDKGDVIVKA